MRIDAHQHYWQIARGDYGWLTSALGPIYRDFLPDDLRIERLASGIEGTVLVQAAPSIAETDFMLAIARSDRSVKGVVGWLDFEAPDAPESVRHRAADPLLVGLRPMIQDIPDPDWMLRPAISRVLEAMEASGLVFDALIKPVHLPRLLTLARRHPGLSIVIDHLAKPDIAGDGFAPWAREFEPLAQLSNVVVKLSGAMTEARPGGARDALPYLTRALDAFGPRRVLFGSDWPVMLLAGSYHQWVELVMESLSGCTPFEIEQVMGGNAVRIYGLEAET
jgi:L-fuconolactonase